MIRETFAMAQGFNPGRLEAISDAERGLVGEAGELL